MSSSRSASLAVSPTALARTQPGDRPAPASDTRAASAVPREHALDAARGILVLLGVLIHAASIYAPGARWLVTDADQSRVFHWISELIHLFRMPAFFWVSGFFTAMVLARDPSLGGLGLRLKRIGVPFLFVWWAVIPLRQTFFEDGLYAGSWLHPVYHLWFLVDLMVFTLVFHALRRWWPAAGSQPAAAGAPGSPARGDSAAPATAIGIRLLQALAFAAAAWGLLALLRATGKAHDPLGPLTSLYRLGEHLPFFLFGAWMQRRPQAMAVFLGWSGWAFPVALAVGLGAPALGEAGGRVAQELGSFIGIAAVFIAVGSLLGSFRRRFTRPHPLLRRLSDSSYTIYLLHHGVVILVGASLTGVALPIALKYAVVVSLAVALPYAVWHLLVRRHWLLSWLLSGREPDRPAASGQGLR